MESKSQASFPSTTCRGLDSWRGKRIHKTISVFSCYLTLMWGLTDIFSPTFRTRYCHGMQLYASSWQKDTCSSPPTLSLHVNSQNTKQLPDCLCFFGPSMYSETECSGNGQLCHALKDNRPSLSPIAPIFKIK